MAGLRGFASHGGSILSRGWLATMEGPGYPRHPLPLKRGSWVTLRLLNYIRNGVSTLLVYRRGKVNLCEMFGKYTRKV